jgi:heme a synthase
VNSSLHRAVWAVAIATFPLIWLGGLVTTHQAGMSVPDWPNSFGYNMFALPWDQWIGQYAGGIFYEHSHRLLGTLVGLLALTATFIAWGPSRSPRVRRFLGTAAFLSFGLFLVTLGYAWLMRGSDRIDEAAYKRLTHLFSGFASLGIISFIAWLCRRRDEVGWRRWLATLLLGCIILQGIKGGLRVGESSLLLAKAHGVFGQLVFALAVFTVLATSRWWASTRKLVGHDRFVNKLAIGVLALVVLQLALGALMRHDPLRSASTNDGGAGLAIPDWPLHYGKLVPPLAASEIADVNRARLTDFGEPLLPTSTAAIHLHFSHRLGAYLTSVVIIATAFHVWFRTRRASISVVAAALLMLVVGQLTLGVLTVLWRKPADIATAHQANGALLLAAAVLLVAMCMRVNRKSSFIEIGLPDSARTTSPVTVPG